MKSWKEHLLLIFFIFNLNGLYPQYSDSSNHSLSSTNLSADSIYAKDNLNSLYQLSSYEDAVSLAQQYVDSALLTKDSTQLANMLLVLGIMQENKGDNSNAFETLLNAYTIFKSSHNQIGTAVTMDHLGTIFRYHGSKQKSLEYHTKAYEILKQGNNAFGLINVLNNLGIINRQLGKDKEALEYHKQALGFALDTKSNNISSIYISIGTYYWYKGVNDSALYYYKSALNIPPDNLLLKERHCAALNNIGNAYRTMFQYDSALYYYDLAIIESRLYRTRNLESVNLKNLGRIYALLGQYDKAFNFFQSSLQIATEINLKKVILENYYWLGELFEKQQDYKNALVYFKKHSDMQNVILAEKQLTEINQLERDFLFEQSAKRHALKLKDNSEQNLLIQKRRTSEIFYIAILFILLSSSLFIYFLYRTKKKSNLLLINLNEELELKVIDRTKSLFDAKEKAEEGKANITAIIEGTNNSIWAFNNNYQILYINHVFQEEFLQTFGVLLEPGKDLIEALPETLQPIWKPRYDRVIGNEQFTTEDAIPTDNGNIYIQVSFNPIVKNGKVIGGSCFGSNITARKYAEIELQKAKEKAEESEKMLLKINKKHSAMIENIGDVIAIVGTDGMTKYQSPNIEKWFGWKPEELLGNSWDKIHPEDVEMIQQEFAKVLESDKTLKVEYRFKCKDGNYKPIELTASNLTNDPTIGGILLNYHDISERKKAEQIQKVLYNISNAVISTDNLNKLSTIIQKELGTIIDTTNFYIAIYDYKTDMFSLPHLIDEKEDVTNFPAGKSFTNYVLKTKKSLLANKERMKEMINSEDIEMVGVPSKIWLGVPLKIKEEVIGVLAVQSYTNEFAFNENDKELLEFISEQVSISIERKKAEEDLNNSLMKANESDRLKSAFLANMSHEIRTPMNGILGFTNLLRNPNISGKEQQKYVDIIQKSGNRMLSTVNDIIDISRIESGQAEISISEVNINEQLKYLHSFFKPEATKKGIQLIIKNDLSEQDNWVITDLEKLNAILTNLIKNAIKFTNKGVIELGYKINKEDGSAELEFYIKDSGIGIPKDRQEAIFDRFVQADIEDKQANQGSGLGLAISKAYAEMLGGKIWVDSEEGKGSTFYFIIDYNSESESKSISKNDEQILKEDNITGKLKILVVEDDKTSQDLISILVEKIAEKIINVSSGLEAVEVCRNNADIDVILMDIQLPDLNGYDATQQIREFNKDVIIISQTAYALDGDYEKSIEAGCNDYISKPIDKIELLSLIQKHLKKHN